MSSDYRLQIVHLQSREIVQGWQPGDRVELDLVEELCSRLKAKGVAFRSEQHILTDLRQAFGEMLYQLKERV